MKTDDLINLLASNAEPVPGHAVARRLALALSWGVAGAVLLLLATLGLRPDLAQAASHWQFWLKPGFVACLALAGWLATERLARPGVRLGSAKVALAAPLVLLWLLAVLVLLNAAPAQRAELIFGDTWKTCPLSIAMLSLPLLAATLWAMKGLAPTRLALAGASAGLLAGAMGALVYALHCPESTLPFLATWYVLGMAIPTLAGALLGPRLLRW